MRRQVTQEINDESRRQLRHVRTAPVHAAVGEKGRLDGLYPAPSCDGDGCAPLGRVCIRGGVGIGIGIGIGGSVSLVRLAKGLEKTSLDGRSDSRHVAAGPSSESENSHLAGSIVIMLLRENWGWRC